MNSTFANSFSQKLSNQQLCELVRDDALDTINNLSSGISILSECIAANLGETPSSALSSFLDTAGQMMTIVTSNGDVINVRSTADSLFHSIEMKEAGESNYTAIVKKTISTGKLTLVADPLKKISGLSTCTTNSLSDLLSDLVDMDNTQNLIADVMALGASATELDSASADLAFSKYTNVKGRTRELLQKFQNTIATTGKVTASALTSTYRAIAGLTTSGSKLDWSGFTYAVNTSIGSVIQGVLVNAATIVGQGLLLGGGLILKIVGGLLTIGAQVTNAVINALADATNVTCDLNWAAVDYIYGNQLASGSFYWGDPMVTLISNNPVYAKIIDTQRLKFVTPMFVVYLYDPVMGYPDPDRPDLLQIQSVQYKVFANLQSLWKCRATDLTCSVSTETPSDYQNISGIGYALSSNGNRCFVFNVPSNFGAADWTTGSYKHALLSSDVGKSIPGAVFTNFTFFNSAASSVSAVTGFNTISSRVGKVEVTSSSTNTLSGKIIDGFDDDNVMRRELALRFYVLITHLSGVIDLHYYTSSTLDVSVDTSAYSYAVVGSYPNSVTTPAEALQVFSAFINGMIADDIPSWEILENKVRVAIQIVLSLSAIARTLESMLYSYLVYSDVDHGSYSDSMSGTNTNDVDFLLHTILWSPDTKPFLRPAKNSVASVIWAATIGLVAVAVAAALVITTKTLIKKAMSRSYATMLHQATDLKAAFDNDPTKENWKAYKKQAFKLNLLGSIFGFGSYDMYNSWVNAPDSSCLDAGSVSDTIVSAADAVSTVSDDVVTVQQNVRTLTDDVADIPDQVVAANVALKSDVTSAVDGAVDSILTVIRGPVPQNS